MQTKTIVINYFKKQKAMYSSGIIFILIATVSTGYLPRQLGKIVNLLSDTSAANSVSINDVYKQAFILLFLAVLIFVARFFWRLLIMSSNRGIERFIRQLLFKKMQELSSDFYIKHNTGELITRAIADVQGVRMMVGMGILGMVEIITINIVSIYNMITTTNFLITLIVIAPIPFLLWLLVKIRMIVRLRFADLQQSVTEMSSKVQENITGIRIIKAFTEERSESETFGEMSKVKWRNEMRLARISALISPAGSIVFAVIYTIFLIAASKLVVERTLNIGDYVAFGTYIALILDPINRISKIIQVWQRGLVSMQRLDVVMYAKASINDNKADKSIKKIAHTNISFKNLTFKYPESDTNALQSLEFEIEENSVLAVMGSTGAGKTTLMNLLLHLWEVPENKIFIGGLEINKIPLHVLRSAFAYVPQDNFLFSDTIMNNIRFYEEQISKSAAREAAKAAAVYDNIMSFPDDFNTIVGERGMTLSGGQKQRVAISRALARNPQFLILDDSLSAVDTETEHLILTNLKKYIKNCTTIIVTHRASAAMLADKILFLTDDGKKAAFGTHEELCTTCETYAALLRSQDFQGVEENCNE